MKQDLFGCFSGLSTDIADMLVKNEYSQLIKIDIQQLSRLNAQNGAFLWDIAGLLPQQLLWDSIGASFVFKHIDDEHKEFAQEKTRLFSRPNPLESEILRIFTKTATEDGMPQYSGIYESR